MCDRKKLAQRVKRHQEATSQTDQPLNKNAPLRTAAPEKLVAALKSTRKVTANTYS
jgi:hypothetical protein